MGGGEWKKSVALLISLNICHVQGGKNVAHNFKINRTVKKKKKLVVKSVLKFRANLLNML